ncbi:MAG: cyclic nucleotide-binding domain-containing protein [Gracilimonas sp.]
MNELITSFKTKRESKHSFILQAGEVEEQLKFVHSGFIREYYAEEAIEHNINFFEPGEFSTDFLSFQSGQQTRKWHQCLTDIELRVLSKSQFNHLLAKYSCGRVIVEKAFQNILECLESKAYNRLTKKPEAMYQHILEHNPSWVQHIPQYHLASFLNITPETLSRIRKRIS